MLLHQARKNFRTEFRCLDELRAFQEACRRVSVGRVEVPGKLRSKMLEALRDGKSLINVRLASPTERSSDHGRPGWIVEASRKLRDLLKQYHQHVAGNAGKAKD